MELNNKLFKNKILANYRSVASMEHFKDIKKVAVNVADFLNNKFNNLFADIDYKTSQLAISKEFIDKFNVVFELVVKDNAIIEKWQALSNTKKKNVIVNALMLFCLKNGYVFDRAKSVYNKQAKCYSIKEYTQHIGVRLYELFYQVGIALNEMQ